MDGDRVTPLRTDQLDLTTRNLIEAALRMYHALLLSFGPNACGDPECPACQFDQAVLTYTYAYRAVHGPRDLSDLKN